MKTKLFALCLVLILGGLILSACGQATIEPTKEVATVLSTDVTPDGTIDMEFAVASDAALAHIREQYGEQAPPQGLAWTIAQIDPEGPVGSRGFQYTGEDWVVEVSRPVLPPDRIVYRVVVVNQATGFRWVGEVDATGHVLEAPEEIRAARDAALAYAREHYGNQVPPLTLSWAEEDLTPEGMLRSATLRHTSGDWVVKTDRLVVLPDGFSYRVLATNETMGFRWEGEVDEAGRVTESSFGPLPVPQASAEVLAARDKVLTYLTGRYGEQAPPPGMSWVEESITPEGLIGQVHFQFAAGDWVVTVSHGVVPPKGRIYRVTAANQATAFQWEGRVNAAGNVMEGPEIVLIARYAALQYVWQHYGEQVPTPDLTWKGGRITPEGLVGSETFEYSLEDWVVTVSYAVVAPESVVYRIVVANPTTGFRWEGELDAERYLTETAAPEGPSTPEVMLDRIGARDAALSYIYEHYQYAPVESLAWAEENITPEGLVGSSTFRYTTEDWVATISYPMAAPDAVIYQVVVANQATWFRWEGEVDAAGQVTEQFAPVGEQTLVACYGHVIKLPDKYPFDDFLSSVGAGDFGLVGANAEVEAAIEALRDKEEPGKYAHFWGTISCGVDDYGTCQFVVSRLRPDAIGPFFDPDPVEGWEGTIVSNPPMAQYDDYFVLAGDFPLGYGIDSSDAALAAQLTDLRDTRTSIRVWGQLYAGVMDVNGVRIDVTRLEVVQKPPAPPAPADWASYVDADYGFAFRYPATWLLEEVPAWEDGRGKFAPSVKLSQGTVTLVIGYKPVTDDVLIEGGGAAGDLIPRGSVTFLGQELRRKALVYEGKDKAVYYLGTGGIQVAHLIFGISLHDFGKDYQTNNIPETLQAEVDRIVESFELVPVEVSTVVGWCGLVVGTPEGAQFSDYLALQPAGAGEIGLTGADAAIEAEIEALRDRGRYANFWGTLTCGVPAYGSCELLVTRLDPGKPPGPLFAPDPVEGWEGQVFSVPGLAQFDDYFILDGPFPVTFGIAGAGVEELRDTTATVRIWGEIQCGIPDVCGCSIMVDRYEIVSEASPKLGTHFESPVDGWYGRVVGLSADARYDDYLRLLPEASGDVGLTGIDAATEATIQGLRTSGTPAHFWGTITCGVPDYDGCRITVTRILPEGAVSSPEPPSSWAGRYFFGAGLGQFDDCLILAGPFGVRYGLEAANERVKAALEELRKIDKLVGPVPDIRIWGEMHCGVPDVNGCRILVEHLEELFSW